MVSLATTVVLLGVVSGAHAAGTAVFSGYVPAPGSAVLKAPNPFIIKCDDTAPITYGMININGVNAWTVVDPVGHWVVDVENETSEYIVDDATNVALTGYRMGPIVNGTNTVVATVISANGISSNTWSFDYVTGTSVTTVTPTPDSVLGSSPAGISVSLASPFSTFTSSMKIDGKVVPTTYSAATKTFTHSPTAALAPGAHTVAFTANAQAGSASRTWTFTVRPPMSTASDCASCHPVYAASHPLAGCEDCHVSPYTPAGHGSAVPSVAGCMGDGYSECHVFDHSGNQGVGMVGFKCADCHKEAYPAVPQHTDAETASQHTVAGCDPCHEGSLINEHAKYPTAASIKYQCALCHAPNTSQRVKDAVAAGNTNCVACHSLSGDGHEALHVLPRTDPCADCHAGPSLTKVHTIDCAGCHESTATLVVAAIAANDKNCASCHPGDPHPDADHTVGGPCTTSGCHATDAITIHEQGPNCSACHGSGVTPSFVCSSCHAAAHADANHGTTDTCASCHSTGNLMTIHGDDCAKCHPTPAQGKTYTGACDQSGCHSPVHAEVAGHNQSHGYGDDCWECHPGDGGNCDYCHREKDTTPPTTTSSARSSYTTRAYIRLFPVDAWDWGGTGSGVRATRYRLDGGALQTGTNISVEGPASGTETHTLEFWSTDQQYNTESHKNVRFSITAGGADVTAPTGTMSVSAGATYTASVGVNISSNIVDAHTGVTQMRVDPGSGTFGAWVDYWPNYSVNLHATNGTKTVRVEYRDTANNVLTLTDTIILDTVMPTGSIVVNANAGSTATLTVNLTMTAADALSGVSEIRLMDNGNWIYGPWEPFTSSKVRTLAGTFTGVRYVYMQVKDAAGNIAQYNDTIIYDPIAPAGTMNVNSNSVYATSTAATMISAVSDTGGSGGLQMRIDPGSGTFGSWAAYAASKAFTLEGGEGVRTVRAEYRDNAQNLLSKTDTITLDLTAPTGTMVVASDAASTAVTAVNINAAMSDATSGLNQMRVDPGTGTFGGWIPYTATYPITLPTGNGLKTVRVEYRDNAGLVALKTDTIILSVPGPDTVAPTGSVSVNSGAAWTTTTSVTLTLNASDPGGSGVSSMRFSNDNTNWSAWEAYGTAKAWVLAAGTGNKTVYAQYRDVALNVSASASDTIGFDDAAPTTTSSAVSGTTYYGVQTFALSPADTGGSGVASTWWQLDGTSGPWTSGISVNVTSPASGTVSRTLHWYSRDVATNQETMKSVTFSVAPAAGTVATTSLAIDSTAWLDSYTGSSGPRGEYRIFLNNTLIGTKLANGTTTWDCPEVQVSSPAHIDVEVDCWFDDYSGLWDWNTPLTYTIQLPAGTTRLEASTWSGFQDLNVVYDQWWDDYDDYWDGVNIPPTTLTNIKYRTNP